MYENIYFNRANMTVDSGYFYMMDETNDVLFQKTAGGKTAFNYPTSIDISNHAVSDGFDIDGSLNLDYWNSTLTASGGKVRLTGNPETSLDGVNKILLAGNFDISIDFNIIVNPSISSWALSLRVGYADFSRIFQICRSYNAGSHVYYRQYMNGSSWVDYSAVATTHTSGKLRITRSGNTFTAYYWSGSDWVSLGSSSYALGSLYPAIICVSWGGFPSPVVNVDNFSSVVSVGNVVELEHDGINFWTLQNYSGNAGVLARRWQTLNYVCELKKELPIIGNYTVDTFTVEHYHDTLSSGIFAGENTIRIDAYDSLVISGSILTLGPTTSGSYYEEATVTAVSGQDITLSSGILYNYDLGNNVNFYNNLWIFNNFAAGTLHKVNAFTGTAVATYSGTIYDNITACTFYRVEGPLSSPKEYLVYYKDNRINYLDISSITIDTSMEIDNGIYPIYDISIVGNSLYRLQQGAAYYGSSYNWSPCYNYVLSTTRRFVDTISVSAYPTILPNNATNVSKITALVNDQYGDGVWNKPIYFIDDDSVGFMTVGLAYTDYFFGTGEAVSYYKAGIASRTVTVEGTATQFD